MNLRKQALINNYNISEEQADKIYLFIEYLLEKNRVVNLTRITTDKDIDENISDSLEVLKYLKGSLLDIGSGSGFPGIILAICSPFKVYLVESITKKADFLIEVKDRLNLDNVEIINKRVEEIENIEVDHSTAKAVAILPIILEYSLSILKIGGTLIAQKGPSYKKELNFDIDKLNSKILGVEEIEINDKKRYIIEIRKEKDINLKRSYKKLQKKYRDILEDVKNSNIKKKVR